MLYTINRNEGIFPTHSLRVKNINFEAELWIWISALPLISCVTYLNSTICPISLSMLYKETQNLTPIQMFKVNLNASLFFQTYLKLNWSSLQNWLSIVTLVFWSHSPSHWGLASQEYHHWIFFLPCHPIIQKTDQILSSYFLWSSMTTSLILSHNINTFGLTSHSGSLVYMPHYLPQTLNILLKIKTNKTKTKSPYHIHTWVLQ